MLIRALRSGFFTLALTLVAIMAVPPAVSAAEKFGMIFELSGDVVHTNSRGRSLSLDNQRHILRPVYVGDSLKVGGAGSSVLIVSMEGSKGYRLTPDTTVEIKEGGIETIEGSVETRTGYHAPTQGKGGPMGAVVLRDARSDSCIRSASPLNSKLLSPNPELRWEVTCSGPDSYTVNIMQEDKVIYSSTTDETIHTVPDNIVGYGHTYRWIVDAGKLGIKGGSFSLPTETEAARIQKQITEMADNQESVSDHLSLIFFLKENDLHENANAEIRKLVEKYPENSYLRRLMNN